MVQSTNSKGKSIDIVVVFSKSGGEGDLETTKAQQKDDKPQKKHEKTTSRMSQDDTPREVSLDLVLDSPDLLASFATFVESVSFGDAFSTAVFVKI